MDAERGDRGHPERFLSVPGAGGIEGEMQAEGDVIRVHVPDAPAEFSAFFAEAHRELFKALFFVTGNRADAAELMQDAFLKLWERWDRIDRIDDPRAYLFRVALNGFRMRARAARRATRRLMPVTSSADPFDEVELREDVRSMLLALTQRQRAALVLLDLYGYGSEEAAKVMGVQPSTVRALASQGRAVLRASGGPHA
jgi:RNA polymerase sigma factor (sigma-70 family)